jgi:hypothetical protein
MASKEKYLEFDESFFDSKKNPVMKYSEILINLDSTFKELRKNYFIKHPKPKMFSYKL